MQENRPETASHRPIVRALALLAALMVLVGSIFFLTAPGAQPKNTGASLLPSAYGESGFKTLQKGSSGASGAWVALGCAAGLGAAGAWVGASSGRSSVISR